MVRGNSQAAHGGRLCVESVSVEDFSIAEVRYESNVPVRVCKKIASNRLAFLGGFAIVLQVWQDGAEAAYYSESK